MLKFVVRVVATGFCLSLGSALFKKIQDHVGLGEKKDTDKESKETEKVNAQDGVSDPGLSTV